jgi:type II secretory pathway pseudopilin PulG
MIELLVAIALLSLLMLLLMPVFSYSRKSVDTMNRLDVYHDVRKVTYAVNSSIKLATEVIYPDPSSKHSWKNSVIFRDSLNQLFIFYVNDKNRLVLINYDDIYNGKVVNGRTIAGNVKSFQVRRRETNLIEYKICLTAKGNKDLDISGMVNLANLI